MEQTDDAGRPILIRPEQILVPTHEMANANAMFTSQQVRPGSGVSGKIPVDNPHQERFQPRSSPYLTHPTFGTPDSNAWYMFSNPRDIAAINLRFLDGKQTPVIESNQVSFDMLGVQFRAYFDFTIAVEDHRAAVKCTGAVAE